MKGIVIRRGFGAAIPHSFKSIIYLLIAGILGCGIAYADCGNSDMNVPCNETGYNACLQDIIPKLCTKGEDTCGRLDLILARRSCACYNLTDKATAGALKDCSHTMTPAKFKDSFCRPLWQRHCDAVAPYACDEEVYSACFKDLLATFCPQGNDECDYTAKDSGGLIDLQSACVCASLTDKSTNASGADYCKYTKTPAEIKDNFIKNPLYCDGYVHSPCNEKNYRACMKDLGTALCPNGRGCEGIGPALLASCACENLIDKSKMNNESFCKDYIPPEKLKATIRLH